ncbi:MAG: DMT family transporter [Calditrichia bacterium]
MMAAAVKALQQKIPSQEIVLARSLFMVVATSIFLIHSHLSFWGNNKKLLFLRGFFGFLGLSAFFYTLTTIPIADSVVIQYTSPIFTALLAIVILKEKTNKKQWMAFVLAFIGVVLVIKPGFSLTFIPAFIGLCGACSSGVAYNLVRKLRESEHPMNIIFYLPAVSIPLSLPGAISDFVLPSGEQWIWLILIGAFTFVAQIFLTIGLHREKAAKATTVSYITVVFSILWGLIFWKEIPDSYSLSGAILILGAIYLTASSK